MMLITTNSLLNKLVIKLCLQFKVQGIDWIKTVRLNLSSDQLKKHILEHKIPIAVEAVYCDHFGTEINWLQ